MAINAKILTVKNPVAAVLKSSNFMVNPSSVSNITAEIRRPNLIQANTVPLTTTQSNPAIELKSNAAGVKQSKIGELLDVVAVDPQDGDTLIYNATTQKYVVKPVVIQVENANLDGGNF